MKNAILSIVFILILILTFVACQKKELVNQSVSNLNASLTSELKRGVNAIDDPKFGVYLSFNTKSIGNKIYSHLRNLKLKQRENWEHSFKGFNSMRKASSILKDENWSAYGEDPMASMINENGYFMYNDTLYRDVQLGKELYKIENGNEILIEKNGELRNQQAKGTACNNSSVSNTNSDRSCLPYYSQDQRIIKGYITYGNPVFSSPYVKVRTELTTAICGSFNYVSTQCENIGTEYSYNINAGGQNFSGSQVQHIAYSATYAETTICSGSGLCVGFVITTHFAKQGGTRITVGNRIP